MAKVNVGTDNLYPFLRGEGFVDTDARLEEAGRRYAPYNPGDTKSIVADLLAWTMQRHGIVPDITYRQGQKVEIVAKCLDEWWPHLWPHPGTILTYEENRDGVRVAKSREGQRAAFRRDCLLAWDVALKSLDKGNQHAKRAPVDQAEKANGTPRVNAAPRVKADPLQDYPRWIKEIVRPFCERRNADGKPLEEIGMRYAVDGVKLIKAGVPVDAVRDAVTMHWPEEARRKVGVTQPFDFTAYGVARYIEQAVTTRSINADGVNGGCVPIMLVGPKGTGKSTHARKLAEKLGLPFGAVSMTVGTPPSAFNGKQKIGGDGGHVQSTFERIYAGGGVYLFDEIDAADASLLLIVNEALANGHFHNAATGEVIQRHPDFIPLAGANTLGLGANRDYTGRERLDAASLDRWAAGRVRVNLDKALEQRLVDALVAA